MSIKPLVFVDLDDTLFQTHRKMLPKPQDQIATLDKAGQPLSYMHPKQQHFVHWLIESAEVVPVTARSVEALQRVQIQFQHGAICAHGGVILRPDGQIDETYLQQRQHDLLYLQACMNALPAQLQDLAQPFGPIRTWVVQEHNLAIYVVAKQNQPASLFLSDLVDVLPDEILKNFYIHQNGNNLAFIPHLISKRRAVEYWLQHLTQETNERPILGWGDSISDLGFLSCCDWFGLPKHSQIHQQLLIPHLAGELVCQHS